MLTEPLMLHLRVAQPALAAMAKELGAIVESNLTDTATHLVASDFASEKYKVRPPICLRRALPVGPTHELF
jgi:hypothetical protein